jgi:retron-type reverse transcriptase
MDLFCIRINDCNSENFIADTGLKQGGPLSPILLNFMLDVFAKMLLEIVIYFEVCCLKWCRVVSLTFNMLTIPFCS